MSGKEQREEFPPNVVNFLEYQNSRGRQSGGQLGDRVGQFIAGHDKYLKWGGAAALATLVAAGLGYTLGRHRR